MKAPQQLSVLLLIGLFAAGCASSEDDLSSSNSRLDDAPAEETQQKPKEDPTIEVEDLNRLLEGASFTVNETITPGSATYISSAGTESLGCFYFRRVQLAKGDRFNMKSVELKHSKSGNYDIDFAMFNDDKSISVSCSVSPDKSAADLIRNMKTGFDDYKKVTFTVPALETQ